MRDGQGCVTEIMWVVGVGPRVPTWHGEVLSVYELIVCSVVQLVVLVLVVLGVAVQVLQVGHHCHAAPGVPALSAGRDGHRGLRRRVFLSHPAGGGGSQTSF